jgi:16S rRNA (cytosine1402-N4)-methyltransferase
MFTADKEKEFPHRSVLYHESLKYLQPQPGMRFVDGTLGAGGHAFGILSSSAPDGRLLGLDLDQKAIEIAQSRLKDFGSRVILRNQSFCTIKQAIEDLGWDCVNGVILDLGISSMQVDNAAQGFSFLRDAPLDMRFDQRTGPTAADLLNSLPESDIADIIWKFGEDPRSRKIARMIVKNRPVLTTTQLAEIVMSTGQKEKSKTHPATRTFQALRIAVNNELEVLKKGLENTLASLCSGGRMAVITFHSLEDRIVKQFLQTESKGCICPPEQIICNCGHSASLIVITKKPVLPSQEEIGDNPRTRSAKLRVAEKI